MECQRGMRILDHVRPIVLSILGIVP